MISLLLPLGWGDSLCDCVVVQDARSSPVYSVAILLAMDPWHRWHSFLPLSQCTSLPYSMCPPKTKRCPCRSHPATQVHLLCLLRFLWALHLPPPAVSLLPLPPVRPFRHPLACSPTSSVALLAPFLPLVWTGEVGVQWMNRPLGCRWVVQPDRSSGSAWWFCVVRTTWRLASVLAWRYCLGHYDVSAPKITLGMRHVLGI